MAHQVVLSWTASSDPVSGYNVFRGTTVGGESATPINSSLVLGTTYTDTTVVDGNYDYYVEAVTATGVSSVPSNSVAVVVLPASPTNLTAVAS